MTPGDLERDLLQHGSSLQALARSLLGRGVDAEDAAQETMVRALVQPPRRAGPLGGWLHTVLHSVAAKMSRGRARQRQREERAARPEAVPDAAAVAMRRETLQAVVDAVFALPEPYRTAIWQRFFEGQLPGAMAARSGEPLATVKSRLQRALGMLRERLDARELGDWRATLAVAFGMEPAAGTVAAFGTGVFVMGTGTKIACVCAAAVVVALGVLFETRPGTNSGGDTTQVGASTRGVAAEAPAASRPGETTQRTPVPAPEPQVHRPLGELRVVVLTDALAPVPGVQVLAELVEVPLEYSLMGLGHTDDQGSLTTRVDRLVGTSGARRLRLRPTFPGAETVVALIEVASPPPSVELRLPPAGSVTVQVLDPSGEPLDPRYLHKARVALGTFDQRPKDRNVESDGFEKFPLDAPIDARGIAHFPAVALDRHVVAQLDFFTRMGFAGPTRQTPHVAVTLQEDPGSAVFVARVLGPDRTPFASQRLSIGYRAGGGRALQTCRSDGEGRIRCSLGTYPVGQQATVTVGDAPGAGRRITELPSCLVRAGRNDLGDVILTAPRVLVAGRLVTERGTEAVQPSIQLERWSDERWQQEWNLNTEFVGAGRFELRGGIPEGERVRLVFGPGQYLPIAPIECPVGTTDLEIRLRLAPTLKARFLVDQGIAPRGIAARLRRTQPPEDPSSGDATFEGKEEAMTQPEADGALSRTWDGLTPGTYTLSAHCPGCDEPVVALQDLVVDSGPCPDPRLSGIDLRGRLTRIQVRATDAGGLALVDKAAFVVLRAKGKRWRGFSLHRGVVELVASAPVDLLVVAPGHRVAEANGVRADQTIALERAHETWITVELPAPLPEDVEVRVRLTPLLGFPRDATILLDTGRGMGVDGFFTETVLRGPDGRGALAVRRTGRYSVVATLARGGGNEHFLYDLEPREVVLDASTPGAGITIKLLPAAFEQTLRGLAK